MTAPKFTTAAPYIASYVLLREGNKVAFVLRKNTKWMDGYYGLPSGKVEWNETFSAGATREAEEEVGVTIKPEHVHHAITVHRHDQDTDWVDTYFEVDEWAGEVTNMEPEVHSEIAWLDITNLPENVIPTVKFAVEQIAAGARYAEFGWDEV